MIKSIYSEQYMHLLAWLQGARTEQGLSMRDLGAIMNKPHSFIGKVETGERRLDVYEYVQYCQALNLSPEKGLELLK